jgi:2-oxoacid:acceptor oxidoreductase gamma subunit (pyruvate/2-ketoisovalerate family)
VIEIRFHGRGGQGSVVAAKVLAEAFFHEAKHVQSFPAFGVERRGAPVMAFTRVDDAPIYIRCNIYEPDVIIVLDPTLLSEVAVTDGMKSGGLALINIPHEDAGTLALGDVTVATVNATEIAVRHSLGTNTNPIVNTAILGAYARASGLVTIESVAEAIRVGVPKDAEKNAEAAEDAFRETHILTSTTEQA